MSHIHKYEFYVLADKDGYYVSDDVIGIVSSNLEAEKFATKEEAETILKYRADKDRWEARKVTLTAYH